MQAIGLVGVGFIGKLLSESLQEADYPLTVYDSDQSQVDWATERGATAAGSPAELAEAVDTVIMALPGTPEVEQTMTGDRGMIDVLEEGQVVIDTTTTSVQTALANAVVCDQWDIHWVTAPLTRAAPVEGIHMMVGADDAAYEAASDVIETVSARHLRFEDPEDALRFKYMLQIRYAAKMAVDAEIVTFAEESGIDPRPLNDFLGMDISENLLTGDYTKTVEGLGALAIWEKDLAYALQVAQQDKIPMPLTTMIQEAYNQGFRYAKEGEGDAATIARYWQSLKDRQ